MKKFKKFISLVLSCAMLMLLCVSACSASDKTALMSSARSDEIIETYADQIAYFSEVSGTPIHAITEETLTIIKDIMYQDPALLKDEACNAMMLEIAEATTLYQLEVNEYALLAKAAATQDERVSRAINGELRVVNKTATPLMSSVSALRGTVVEYIPVGGTYPGEDISITVNAGTVIKNIWTLSVNVTASAPYSQAGPTPNTRLKAKTAYVTHHVAYGVLYGILERVEYDVVNIDTGELVDHYSYIGVNESTKHLFPYTLSVSLGNPTYVDHTRYDETFAFTNVSAFERTAVSTPEYFID